MFNNRQAFILQQINSRGHATSKEIIALAKKKFDKVSKPTILRDIGILQKNDQIVKKGGGRSVLYEPKIINPLLHYIEIEPYFAIPHDQREIKQNFNWKIFEHLNGIFTTDELARLTTLNKKYLAKKNKLFPYALKKELERLTIELSWKSSELEGNTYSLIDTEILIKESHEAPGHNKEEAIMILNHKTALDYIFSNPESFKQIKMNEIRGVHSLLIKDLGVPDDFRKIIVRIIGTNYRPLDNEFQIKEALEKATQAINNENEPPAKALLAIALFSYIQPFVDGNKRTSRLMANALLSAYNWCPISLRNMEAAEYKKAMILFYEQNSLRYFKELFIKQFEFAVENYFG